ncbi:MAG: sigma 54-interacting transcriptional regulator [Kofleriaceae bacterium]|nr:sigma 54-interacting transcriptional regulator [Kofleriaceae bacterium]
MAVDPTPLETEAFGAGERAEVRGFRIDVIEGAPNATLRSTGARCAIGSHPRNELVVDDATVSRFHCELSTNAGSIRVRDLGSRNGTILDGVRVIEADVRDGSIVRLGRAALRITFVENQHVSLSSRTELGGLVGVSPALRATFAVLERAAATDATVLLEGETGTGKGAMAEALHVEGARRDKPFVIVDCGALSPTLLESELFGHEKGAFTGAEARRIGAFEEADGGTLFLDEIGELPSDLQPKLLRVLENREVRRIGQNTGRKVDFRLIAASNRDLRAEVNAGRFRSDLYYRLAVVTVSVPPLRQRREDIPAIARAILTSLRASPDALAELTSAAALERLSASAWPGNVRELRNYLERSLVLGVLAPAGESTAIPLTTIDPSAPYAEARRVALDAFERDYVAAVLRTHDGNVAAAAKSAGIARYSFYRLLRRHGL